jgi:hypothetical protein
MRAVADGRRFAGGCSDAGFSDPLLARRRLARRMARRAWASGLGALVTGATIASGP